VSRPQVIDDEEHERIYDQVAAIDVAKDSGMVCTRTPHPSRPGARQSTVWTVRARMNAIRALGRQLARDGIEIVTLESTSDYWRIWFFVLEACGLAVQLVSAAQAKNLPGRPKTDKLDAMWLARLTELGLLRASFVPPKAIRDLRDYTRARTRLVQERTRCWQRLEKLLEGALIKVSAVASTLTTVSAQDMIKAMIAGERDPQVLAGLARGRMKAKHDDLVQALTGMFDDHHGELAQLLLDQVAFLDGRIAQLTARAAALTAAMPAAWGVDPDGTTGPDAGTGPGAPVLPAVTRLAEIPGLSPDLARVIIAESGSPGALPRRGPLGTVLARYQAHGSGKPLGRCGLWCWRPAAAGFWLAPAGGVYQAGSFPVRRAVPVVDEAVGGDGPAGRAQPPAFPFPGGLGRLLGAEQVLPAERAAPVLPGEQAQAVAVQRGFHPPPPRGPVVGQVRVIG
jgi:transposase